MFDLHTHTTHSDGTTTAWHNAHLAAAAGLQGLALTDHDTTAGWAEQAAACDAHGLSFVPGVELSTELAGRSVHILGYWVDPDHPAFAAECARLRDERGSRARLMLERLGALGIGIDEELVRRHAGGAPIGRPHLAAAMIEVGAVPDLRTAFDEYLGDGGPVYVPKRAVPPEEGVRLVRAAGGAAVLAHPGLDGPIDLALLDRLAGTGLAGVEADHAGHAPEVRVYWREVARERELLVTGASDFHGDNKDVRIGASCTPAPVVEALRALAATATVDAAGGPGGRKGSRGGQAW
jgi:3',5'-nucleoside bisphosphate phosphatase